MLAVVVRSCLLVLGLVELPCRRKRLSGVWVICFLILLVGFAGGSIGLCFGSERGLFLQCYLAFVDCFYHDFDEIRRFDFEV